MRRDNGSKKREEQQDELAHGGYFTYRPLSNLPTPPPSSRESSVCHSPSLSIDEKEHLEAKYRGPAIHLVNLIPSSASLATPAVPLVQAMLTRANLPLETVALAVCILDSLDAKFARTWRLSCPLSRPGSSLLSAATTLGVANKRHTMPPTPNPDDVPRQLHIDSVRPELIVLAALVIADKFTDDPQASTQHYTDYWGRGMWSNAQLNATERCIMERLEYRIMPLCDEDCLTDAMVDMQLAARQLDHGVQRQPTPPESVASPSSSGGGPDSDFTPSHARSKTVSAAGLGLSLHTTGRESLSAGASSRAATPKPLVH